MIDKDGDKMSSTGNKNKMSAITAWILALLGGLFAGLGIGIILISRVMVDRIVSLNSNLAINAVAYGDIQTLGAILVILGIIGAVLGVYYVGRVQRTNNLPPPP
jgi:hypothetical protein